MLRGADKEIKDCNDKIPIDLVKDVVEEEHLRADLYKILGPPGALDCLMLSPPNRLTHKNSCTMTIYVSIFVFCHLILLTLVYPRLPWPVSLAEFTLALLTLMFMSLASCTNPGFVKNEVDFFDLVRIIDSTTLCPDCETVRTSRSRHCAVCHQCVERFDHHCPWINNCVGVKNHNYFLAYISLQWLVLLFSFAMCVWALVLNAINQHSFEPVF